MCVCVCVREKEENIWLNQCLYRGENLKKEDVEIKMRRQVFSVFMHLKLKRAALCFLPLRLTFDPNKRSAAEVRI